MYHTEERTTRKGEKHTSPTKKISAYRGSRTSKNEGTITFQKLTWRSLKESILDAISQLNFHIWKHCSVVDTIICLLQENMNRGKGLFAPSQNSSSSCFTRLNFYICSFRCCAAVGMAKFVPTAELAALLMNQAGKYIADIAIKKAKRSHFVRTQLVNLNAFSVTSLMMTSRCLMIFVYCRSQKMESWL